jgi:hypothetical protein
MVPLLLTAGLDNRATAAAEPPAAALPAVALKDLDLHKGWFKPVPAKDGDPICATLATDARRYFLLAGEWSYYAAEELAAGTGLEQIAHSSEYAAHAELRSLPDQPGQLVLERPNQPRLFLYFHDRAQCDTSCNAQRLIVSDQRIADTQAVAPDSTAQTPDADAWTLYRASTGAWYVAGIVDQHLQLYALATPAQWRLSCDVALAPYRLRASLDPSLHTTLGAIDRLYGSMQALSSAASSDCHRNSALKKALEQTLYRPWQWLYAGAHDDYRQFLDSLEVWSANGADEHAAFERYNAELTAGVDALQRFYVMKFGWGTPVATRVAYDALTGAIRSTAGPIAAPKMQCAKEVTGF